jgi:hypothetical protein
MSPCRRSIRHFPEEAVPGAPSPLGPMKKHQHSMAPGDAPVGPTLVVRLGWPQCGRCLLPLSVSRVFRSLIHRKPVEYPFLSLDGSRRWLPVRWLCEACAERAASFTAAPDEKLTPCSERRQLLELDPGELGEGYLLETILAPGELGAEHVARTEDRLQAFARSLGGGDVEWLREGLTVRFYTRSRRLYDAWHQRHEENQNNAKRRRLR